MGQGLDPAPATVPLPAGAQTEPATRAHPVRHGGDFYGRAADLMADNPPAPADTAIQSDASRLGIQPGTPVDIAAGAGAPMGVADLDRPFRCSEGA